MLVCILRKKKGRTVGEEGREGGRKGRERGKKEGRSSFFENIHITASFVVIFIENAI